MIRDAITGLFHTLLYVALTLGAGLWLARLL